MDRSYIKILTPQEMEEFLELAKSQREQREKDQEYEIL